jgi:hypothetical protein
VNTRGLCRVIAFSAALPLLLGFSRALSQSSTQQTPKKSTSAQSAALTSHEKEAQKHYRIALEAIKNNDLATASDELKEAADLAPKNALIWYNLAVVESKKGDSAPALEHLQEAETLGLPKTLQNDADQLEAKVTYDVKKEVKKQAFSAKFLQLQKDVIDGHFSCDNTATDNDYGIEGWEDSLQSLDDPHKVSIVLVYYSRHGNKRFGQRYTLDSRGVATFDFVDLSPNIQVGAPPFVCIGQPRWLAIVKTKSPAAIHYRGTTEESGPNVGNKETSWVDGDTLALEFHTRDQAEAAAKTMSELIRMRADIQ